jgi:outer membrane protein
MSRKSMLILSLLILSLSGAAMAQAPAAAPATIGPAKMAWINLEQAILTTDDGKALFGDVQKYVDKKNSELEAKKKELDALQNQLNVQGPKLTDDARADLEESLQNKNTELQRFQEDTQKDIDSRRVKVTNTVGRKMMPVIEKVAKEKGLSAVVYFNPSRDAWVDPSLIITDDVVKAYNQMYPQGKAAAPAKP